MLCPCARSSGCACGILQPRAPLKGNLGAVCGGGALLPSLHSGDVGGRDSLIDGFVLIRRVLESGLEWRSWVPECCCVAVLSTRVLLHGMTGA